MKKLKPHTVDWAQIERFLASADKKLASAHKILAFDEEACLQQTVDALDGPQLAVRNSEVVGRCGELDAAPTEKLRISSRKTETRCCRRGS